MKTRNNKTTTKLTMNRWRIIALLLAFVACKKDNNRISYQEVVSKLTDMKALATLPEAGEKSAMWSSYDRKSKITESGEFVSWDANVDGFEPQYIRKEGNQEVLAEMQGPGAIVRIWSASPGDGHVKIYIDGKQEPVIDLPFIDYFESDFEAFDYPELVYETNAKGFNNYVPITYNSSCKIVADPGWGQYYHFNYITFPQNYEVEVFNPKLTEEHKSALKEVNDFFASQMGQSPYRNNDFSKEEMTKEIAPGEDQTMFTHEGTAAITAIKLNVLEEKEDRMEQVLRKATIQMKWDGQEEPAVWSPLGDFFGTAPGWNTYKTLPMGMTNDYMYSYWYMPFAESAEISIRNDFEEPIKLEIEVGYEELSDADDLGRFHAKWHRDLDPLPEHRWPDWALLETQGRGRFVGTQLTVWNPKGGSCTLAGPGHWWWGEGDEKFFVDGEVFPSTFGTGTEDYFGYAWCTPARFERAYHSQSLDNGNMGYQPMNRWHIIDNIPFQQSFDGYLEKYFPNEWPTQYSTVVYWYLEPGGTDPIDPVPVEERYGFETPFEVYREDGAVEGESFKIAENSGGWSSTNVWVHETLFTDISGHKVFRWVGDPEKENKLVAEFPWEGTGTYQLIANVIKQKQGGVFSVNLNGKKLGTIDCYGNTEGPGEAVQVTLGKIDVTKGDQRLELEWNQKEGRGKILRIDFLKFVERN